MRKLGQELRVVRKIKHLSLVAAAGPAKISAAYLQKLENGVVRNPSPRVLQRLAGVLDISYGRLMELAGYLPPETARDSSGRDGLIGQVLGAGDLTDDEQRAVIAFIAYLKDHRP